MSGAAARTAANSIIDFITSLHIKALAGKHDIKHGAAK